MAAIIYTQTDINYDIVQALLNQQTVAAAVTAHAGGGQALAVAITATFTNVSVVATAADSVALPLAVAGQLVFVRNSSANSMQVFAANGSTDTINGTAGSTGVAHAAATGKFYFAVTSAPGGAWVST